MVIRAVAVEWNGAIEVQSTAPGRARRFSVRIGTWCNVRGSNRAEAMTARVLEELRRLGVRDPCISIRAQYKAV